MKNVANEQHSIPSSERHFRSERIRGIFHYFFPQKMLKKILRQRWRNAKYKCRVVALKIKQSKISSLSLLQITV